LNGAFGKPSRFRKSPETCSDWLPPIARRLTIKIEVNEISRRLLIVTDQIAHQDIEDVIVDWDGLFKTRHFERIGMKEER
jgi:hypothetical protein